MQRNSLDQQSVAPSRYTSTREETMTPSEARSIIASALIAAIPITIVAVANSCAPVFSALGLATLDSAGAVAIAQRNLCGGARGPTCAVRDYRRDGGRYIITLDRRPPVGNDRVIVTLRDNGSTIEAADAESAVQK